MDTIYSSLKIYEKYFTKWYTIYRNFLQLNRAGLLEKEDFVYFNAEVWIKYNRSMGVASASGTEIGIDEEAFQLFYSIMNLLLLKHNI